MGQIGKTENRIGYQIWKPISIFVILNWLVHIFPLTIQNDKNTNGISDLISDAVFGFS